MAHASCPNGHDMWNGDGTPVVWAYRVGYFREYMEAVPECILDDDWQIYDCTEYEPGEDLDCWYCEKCKGLVVYVDIARLDYKRIPYDPVHAKIDQFKTWEDFIALRDREFEAFQEFYQGKSPLEAIEQYPFKYRYKVSPDLRVIFAFNKKGYLSFGYERSNWTEFSPSAEMYLTAGNTKVPYNPYRWAVGKMDIEVRIGWYAHLKDKRTIQIESIIQNGKEYRGRDINLEDKPFIVIAHSDILSISECDTNT